jgi:PIN domain nuclease of toxin-antitoxin system
LKLLLDTHTLLWSIASGKLSQTAHIAFLDSGNELYLSAVSYWEICLKISIGKLELASDWVQIVDEEMRANQIKWLPIAKEHCRTLEELPFIHNDPFDRLLIAQAQCEAMTLLTADKNIHAYPIKTLW